MSFLRRGNLLPMILIAIILLFLRLGATTVFQIAEARNAQVPVEMMQRSDYIVPYFNANLRTDKPPLHYYAMLLAYKVAGVHEASARFFSALCGLIVVIATALFAKRHSGTDWPAWILLASIHATFQFRLATPDPYLICCHVLSLFCFYEYYEGGRSVFLWSMYVLLGLAFLAKGPVGIALPCITMIVFIFSKKQFNLALIKKYKPLIGSIIVFAVAAPWFFLVHYKTNGQWTRGFFLEHNVGRFGTAVDDHKGPFILPLAFVLGGLFPFSVFSVRAAFQAWKQRSTNTFLLFNLIAALVVILLYSISATKLINYISPAYAFVACFTGAAINSRPGGNAKKWVAEWIVLLVVSVALPIVVYFFLRKDTLLHDAAPAAIIFSLLTICVLYSGWQHWQGRQSYAFKVLATGSVIISCIFHLLLFPFLNRFDSVQLQKQYVQAGRPVVAYGGFNEGLVFYHAKPIPVISSAPGIDSLLQAQPGTLVLRRASVFDRPDSVNNLKMLFNYKDLFSSRYSYIYQRQ